MIGPVDPAYLADVQASRNVIIRNRGMDDEEIARWIRGAVSLVLLSEYEGFGIPAVEAMAAGVPVIASNRAALPETVGKAGLLVDPQSHSQLEEAAEIWRDHRLRDQLIMLGHERAATMKWERQADKLAEILRKRSYPASIQ